MGIRHRHRVSKWRRARSGAYYRRILDIRLVVFKQHNKWVWACNVGDGPTHRVVYSHDVFRTAREAKEEISNAVLAMLRGD
jgi:hypothetical protein